MVASGRAGDSTRTTRKRAAKKAGDGIKQDQRKRAMVSGSSRDGFGLEPWHSGKLETARCLAKLVLGTGKQEKSWRKRPEQMIVIKLAAGSLLPRDYW